MSKRKTAAGKSQRIEQQNPAGVGKKVGAVAVLGAGISGMQASLDLAEMGFKIYLIDNKP